MTGVLDLVRPDLRTFEAYARASEAADWTRLHANECPWRPVGDATARGLNRYPEPRPEALRARLADLYGVEPGALLVTRGSDEAIDLLVRALCPAERSAVVVCPPTFAMYGLAARLQGARVDEVPLRAERAFAPPGDEILARWTDAHRLLFLCSPNNPTGTTVPGPEVGRLCAALAGRGLVVVDEAYVEFAERESASGLLVAHENLVVLRTLSKAWALAGARCGVALGHPDLIGFLDGLLAPYPLATATVEAVSAALAPDALAQQAGRIERLRALRSRLERVLGATPGVLHVWPSEANFLLCQVEHPETFLRRCRDARILVRELASGHLPRGCMRVSVGSERDLDRLERALGAGRVSPAEGRS